MIKKCRDNESLENKREKVKGKNTFSYNSLTIVRKKKSASQIVKPSNFTKFQFNYCCANFKLYKIS